jgi:pimeloyl-ACP methyl ester carboxylesterase
VEIKKHSVHYRDIWLPWRQPKNVSYGGSIITEAGVDPHVVGLVYVAAHAPDVGEDEGALGKKTPSVLAKTEGAIKKTDDGQAEFEWRSQVFAAAEVFDTPLTTAAWTTKPSWGVVALADQIINPDLEKWYYARAHSHTVEIPGASHSVYESHPKQVAAVIEQVAENAQK